MNKSARNIETNANSRTIGCISSGAFPTTSPARVKPAATAASFSPPPARAIISPRPAFSRDLSSYQQSQGVCWARNAIQSLYDGEAYTLQLDSHHRFVAGWDTALIDMLESLATNKPLLTSYAPHYNPRGKRLPKTVPWKIGFDQFTPDGRLLTRRSFIENHRELAKPIPARFYSAHFAFARGASCREVPTSMNFCAQTSSSGTLREADSAF